MSDTVRLHPESIAALAEAVAPAVAQLLREGMVRPAGSRLLTAAQVAQRFGVTRGWVYANADELGARRLGHGSKPRLRFDAEEVAAAMDCRDASGGSQAPVFRGAAENSQRSTQRLAPDHVASLPKRWRDAVAARRPERA